MLKFCLLATAMLLSVHLYAQKFLITGSIRDQKTKELLPGATLSVENENEVTVADEQGKFSLQLSRGEYTLRVRYIGYAEHVETLPITGDVDVSIYLKEEVRMTDEVVVFATRANDKTPFTYSTVNSPSIQRQNFGQDLPMLLNWTPSVVTTSDAGNGIGYTGIRIRGSDPTRINVTINGIPYNDNESLNTFWVDIPDIASSTQSTQIQRGLGSSTNGAGAFGATINLQTNTRNDKPYAEISNAVGSFNTRRHTINFGSGLLNNHWVVDGRVSKINSDGFVDRASSDLRSYYFSTGFYGKKLMVKAIAFGGKERTYQSWYGVPQSRLENDIEAMYTTALNEGWNEEQTKNLLESNSRTFNPYQYKDQVDDYRQDNYHLHFSQRVGTSLSANVSLHYTPGKGYFEEYRYEDDLTNYTIDPITIGDSTITTSDIIRRRWLDNHFYGFTYSFNYEKENITTTLGGAWNRYDGDHFGEVIWAEVSPVPSGFQYYFNNGDKRDFNIFLKATLGITDNLSAYVDAQYRRLTYKVKGIENNLTTINVDEEFNFFNPKAGLMYTINVNHQLYASFAIGNREPVRDDFIEAPAGTQPKHETLHNLEVGYRIAGKNYNFNFNYYLMNYQNQLVLTGQLNDVGAAVRTNVDDSFRTGIEAEGTFSILPKLTLNANITLSQNKIKQFNEILYDYGQDFDEYNEVKKIYRDSDISFSPNIIGGSALTYNLVKNFEATLMTKYVGKQYLDNTSSNERSIDPYLVNDLRFTYTIKPHFIEEISLSLLVNNILNELYESNGYTWGYAGGGAEFRENYYFPQAGRNFLVRLTFKF